MKLDAPIWLTSRRGGVSLGLNDSTWLVTVEGLQQYRLYAAPAKGQFTCSVTHSYNGKKIDGGKIYPTAEAALNGGLEELREHLGW